MPSPKEPSVFRVGDRVTERHRNSLAGVGKPPVLPASRYGEVVATEQRRDSRGHPRLYVSVIWDGRRSPSLHAGHRLLNISIHP